MGSVSPETARAVFPDRTVAGVGPAGVSWNDRNATARVEFEAGDHVFLKTATDGDGTRIRRERAVVAYARRHCDVAVPRVVASDPDADPPYLATAPIAGRSLADGWWDREDRAAVLRQVGAALAEIHDRTFQRHGLILGGPPDDLRLEAGTWADVLAGTVAFKRRLASTDRFESSFEAVEAALEANSDRLNDAPAALVHGDPAHPNLFRDGSTIGLVDWELAHVGDPARELYRAQQQLLHDDSDRLRAALRTGYADRAGSLPPLGDRTPIYEALWHLGTMSVFDHWVENRDESREAAAATIEARVDRALDAI